MRFDKVWILLYFYFVLKGKSLLDYTNLFSPNDYQRNDKIILKYLICII